MRGAQEGRGGGSRGGMAPPESWLTHDDEAVLCACAHAVGHDVLMAIADQTAGTTPFTAARYAWVAAKLGTQGRLTTDAWDDALYRTTDLLALVPEDDAQRTEDEATFKAFENECLNAAWGEWQCQRGVHVTQNSDH